MPHTMSHLEGFHGKLSLGQHNALLVIDMSVGFTDPASPLGTELSGVVEQVSVLLAAARRVGLPIVYTTISFPSEAALQATTWFKKVPALRALKEGEGWTGIDPRLTPREDEIVLTKTAASAFFGTSLASLLTGWGIDSVIVAGASTSGCVRATVVDAVQSGFVPIVARDAVGDRDPEAHASNLRDIDAKYGEVLTVDGIVTELEARRDGSHVS